MIDSRLLVAAGVILMLMGLFSAALVVSAYGTISGKYVYPIPMELMSLLQLVIGASMGVLTVGAVAEYRRWSSEKSDNNNADEPHAVDASSSSGGGDKQESTKGNRPAISSGGVDGIHTADPGDTTGRAGG